MSKSDKFHIIDAFYIFIHNEADIKISPGIACAQPAFHPTPDQ